MQHQRGAAAAQRGQVLAGRHRGGPAGVRVSITVWPTPGTVSSRPSAAAAAANAGTPGTTSYGTPAASSRRICSATALKTDGSPECSRATSWPRAWAATSSAMISSRSRFGGVDQAGARRACGEQLGGDQAAGVQARPGARRAGAAPRTVIRSAAPGPGADEVHRHGRVTCPLGDRAAAGASR